MGNLHGDIAKQLCREGSSTLEIVESSLGNRGTNGSALRNNSIALQIGVEAPFGDPQMRSSTLPMLPLKWSSSLLKRPGDDESLNTDILRANGDKLLLMDDLLVTITSGVWGAVRSSGGGVTLPSITSVLLTSGDLYSTLPAGPFCSLLCCGLDLVSWWS